MVGMSTLNAMRVSNECASSATQPPGGHRRGHPKRLNFGECRGMSSENGDSKGGLEAGEEAFRPNSGVRQFVGGYDIKRRPRHRRRYRVILNKKADLGRARGFGTPFTSTPSVTTTSSKPQSGRTRPD
jgi:hypothetical protein